MRFPRPARLAPLTLAAALLLTACGDSQDEEASSSSSTAPTSDSTSGSTADGAAVTTADTTATPVTLPANVPPKPTVEIPTGDVTELVITDLVDGDGTAAAEGDTVVVHYVGVRSEDGTEFDNSYDRGQAFPVTLGTQSVIPGWEQGLLGAKAGGQRQLDIPADLAYGDSPQGDIIQPGDALTFVVDVMAVIAKSNPADEPTVSVTPGETVDSLQIEDLSEGSGDEVEPGQQIAFDYIFIRSDTGEQLESSWVTGTPQNFPYDEAQLPPVLFEALAGVQVGTLRKVTIPFADASEAFQLPGETDIVLVIQVNAIY
jgi:peptidylprolyl isomerase